MSSASTDSQIVSKETVLADLDGDILHEDNPLEDVVDQDLGHRSRWAIGFDVGLYRPHAIYRGDNMDLIDLRESLEKSLEAFDFAATISYAFNDNWSLNSGVVFSQINQQSTNTRSFIKEDSSSDAIIGKVFSVDGDYYLFGEETTRFDVTQQYERYLSYTSVAIPVTLSYRLVGRKWDLAFSGGFEYSLYGKHSGFEQDLQEVEYDLSLDSESRLNASSSHYGLLGLNIEYAVSDKVIWHLGGQTKLGISGLYQRSEFQKRFNLPGIKTGMRFNF